MICRSCEFLNCWVKTDGWTDVYTRNSVLNIEVNGKNLAVEVPDKLGNLILKNVHLIEVLDEWNRVFFFLFKQFDWIRV